MVWKHVLFPKASSNFYISAEYVTSLRTLSLSAFNSMEKTQKFFRTQESNKDPPHSSRATISPHIVYSTLANCPSDLIALRFFIWCARLPNYFHDRQAFDHMVNVAARLAGRFKSVNGIVRELESIGCVTRVQTFLLFLRIFWHGSMYDMVFEAFEEMMRFGYMPNTFAHNVIIDVSFRIQRADLGLTVLRNMPAPNFLSFNIALCNLCKLNDLNSIGVVLRSMMKTGYYPNVETLVMVLNCFSKKGRMAQAFQLVGLMVSLGNQVSVVVWSILIDGLCKRGRHVLAIYLLEKMIDTGCSPNVVTYTSLVKGLMESEMINDALRILNLMESRGCEVDLVLCNMLIDCFSKIGRYDEALGVFFGLRKHNIYPDSYTYSSLFSTLRLSGKFHLLPKVAGGSVIPADLVVCNSLISYFCKAGLATHAVKFYDSMLEKGFTPDKYTFAGLLNALCRAKIIDEAIKVYHGITMNHFDLDAHVHTMIIGGLIKAGKHHRAIQLFREAVTAKYPLDVVSYTVAIHGLVTGSRVEEAYNLYNQMKEVGFAPNKHICNIMIHGFCKEKDIAMVKQILQQMLDAGIVLDFRTFIRVAVLMSKSRYSPPLFDLLIEMWDSGLMPDKAMHAFLAEGLAHGIREGDTHYPLLKGCLRNNLFAETLSSEDLSDTAAAVG